jgi:Rod binding domain-containing protein
MFVSMLLKEMRSTLEGGLFGEEKSDTYGALFDMHLGQHLADSGALGIRDLLLSQSFRQSSTGINQGETGESR